MRAESLGLLAILRSLFREVIMEDGLERFLTRILLGLGQSLIDSLDSSYGALMGIVHVVARVRSIADGYIG